MKTRRRYRRKSISKRRRRRSTKKKRRYRRRSTKKKRRRRRRRGGEGDGKPKKRTLKRTKPRMIYGNFVDPERIKKEERRLMSKWTPGYGAIQEKYAPELAKKTRIDLRQSAVENVVGEQIKPYIF